MPAIVYVHRDEAHGLGRVRPWTAERDVAMWQALEHGTPMPSAEANL